jgi:hypothetical protein
MVAASLEGGMTLFNYTVEYSVELFDDETNGESVTLRKAVVEFDDFWGKRRTHIIRAPSDLWTSVKVGGTASAGCPPLQGMITGVRQGIFRTVWVAGINREVDCYCLPVDDNPQVGDTVLVVEHMRHEMDQYGTFEKCILRNPPMDSNPNLHSINLIILNDNDQVGIIHLDPYVDTAPNYDDMDNRMSRKFVS